VSTNLFEPDRPWLARQRSFAPWDEGCARAQEQLGRWLDGYAGQLGLGQAARAEARGEYLRRLWECWAYHWRKAAGEHGNADGWEVAEQARAGQSPQGDGRLGGDVLRDVVLATAVLHGETEALLCFEREYREHCLRAAGRVRGRAVEEEWWEDLLDRLGGYSRPPGKLASFQGRCGLGPWLGTVGRRFALDRAASGKGPRAAQELPREVAASAAPAELLLVSAECLELLQGALRSALARLKAADRLLLHLSFAEGLEGKEVAAVLGIHPGNVSRRREAALGELRDRLSGGAEGPKDREREHDCLRHLLGGGGRLRFGEVLLEALREGLVGELR
jgi:RNA polymerase sigma factor (sigma-70 family)